MSSSQENRHRIRIENIYYMLAYAFRTLNEKDAERYSDEKFEHVVDLLGEILAVSTARQIKAGLYRDYITLEEKCTIPRGKICIAETVRELSAQRKTVVCSVGEYLENTLSNRVLKSTMILLLRSPEVRLETKEKLKSELEYFHNVDETDIRHISWNRFVYSRNNRTYRMLMYICYLILDGMIMRDDDNGSIRMKEFVDDQKMYNLYERFLYEYYRVSFPHLKVSKSEIDWNLNSGGDEFLPEMVSDVMLEDRRQGKVLIIDAKYYTSPLQKYERSQGDQKSGRSKIRSDHLYQIYAYVKNRDRKSDGSVSGMLLYAGTDGPNPDSDYVIDGNRIRVKTLNLDCDFGEVRRQLDGFIYDWSPEQKDA